MKTKLFIKHQLVASFDPRVELLQDFEGAKGYGAYWYILENLSGLPAQRARLTYLFQIRKKGFTYAFLKRVVEKYELFTIRDGYFYANELNLEDPVSPDEAVNVASEKDEETEKSNQILNVCYAKSNENEEQTNEMLAKIERKSTSSARVYTREDKIISETEKKQPVAAAVVKKKKSTPQTGKQKLPNESWMKWVNALSEKNDWVGIACMRSEFSELLQTHFKEAVEKFKEHVYLYRKGCELRSTKDAQQYFLNFISPGQRTAKELYVYLKKLKGNAPPCSDVYRFEKLMDGKRTYNGQLIPPDAPPRPDDTALWNEQTEQWVSIKKKSRK